MKHLIDFLLENLIVGGNVSAVCTRFHLKTYRFEFCMPAFISMFYCNEPSQMDVRLSMSMTAFVTSELLKC